MSYTDRDIRKMSDAEHIRKFPGRHMGEFDTPAGLVHPIKEIVSNSVDEALVSKVPTSVIDVVVAKHKRTYQCMVRDRGRGMPLRSMLSLLTETKVSGKWGESYSASGGCHGEGAKATFALSNEALVLSRRGDEGSAIVTFKGGNRVLSEVLTTKKYKSSTTGTTAFFELDESIYTTADTFFDTSVDILTEFLRFLTAFVPGLTIRYQLREQGLSHPKPNAEPDVIIDALESMGEDQPWLTFANVTPRTLVGDTYGVKGDVIWECKGKSDLMLTDPNKKIGLDFDLFLTSTPGVGMIGSVNLIPVSEMGSFHIKLLLDYVKRRISSFIDSKDIREFVAEGYRLPLYGTVAVRVQEPKFVDQTKEKYRDKTFIVPYTELLGCVLRGTDALWEKLAAHLEQDINDQYTAFINRRLGGGRSFRNIGLSLATKKAYVPCKSTDNTQTELIICEGQSAGGTAVSSRDPFFQAVFKVRGKSLNTARATVNTITDNQIISDLLRVSGITIGDNDPSKLNFARFIILTDADHDGAHIASLLVGLFYDTCPAMLERGMVCIANPPLYGLGIGGRKAFLKDEIALMDTRILHIYRKAMDLSLVDVVSNTQRDLDNFDEFRAYFYLVDRVGQLINSISKRLVIHPDHIEALASVIHYLTPSTMDTRVIAAMLGVSKVVYNRAENFLVITTKDSLDTIIQLDQLVETLVGELIPTLADANWGTVLPKITWRVPIAGQYADYYTRPVSISHLWLLTQQMNNHFPVKRFKGLGEMTAAQLSCTCLDPNTRIFATVTGVGDVDLIYGMLGSDPAMRKSMLSA